MCEKKESGSRADAINDPDVLWAVIEGLLARLPEIPPDAGTVADPVVVVFRGDRSHHRHPNCPLLVEHLERFGGEDPEEEGRRIARSEADRAGLSECPACRTHRPDRAGQWGA